MAFNGSGVFNLVSGNPVVTGTTISSTWANNTLSDVATGLSNCVTRDGQSPATANLPMGGYKLTGLALATATGDALSYGRAATVTDFTSSGTITFSGGTANGVAYLNASKQVTSGTAFQFNNGNLSCTGAAGSGGGEVDLTLTDSTSGKPITLIRTGGAYSYAGMGAVEGALYTYASNLNLVADGGVIKFNLGTAGAATEQMRLTSTGLGIGTSSPAKKLDMAGSYRAQIDTSNGSLFGSTLTLAGDNGINQSGVRIVAGYDSSFGMLFQTSTNSQAGYNSDPSLLTYTTRMKIDSSGNLGLGVTPSALLWTNGSAGGLQLQAGGLLSAYNASTYLSNNWYYNSGEKYIGNGYATRYEQTTGKHTWYTAGNNVSGAGAAVSWTQAMTLDASGNLLVGATASPTGSPVGKVLALNGVDIEGTGSINITTTTTLLSRTSGVGGMFFVQGYNASGGAQGWWLLACIGATLTTIASNNATGLTVTFSSPGGGLRAVTASGTLVATCVAFTM